MDEPFGALDAQTKEQMQQFLRDLWRQTNTTIWMILTMLKLNSSRFNVSYG